MKSLLYLVIPTLLLAIGKQLEWIDISWWWVISPIGIPVGWVSILLLIGVSIGTIKREIKKTEERK